MLSSFGGDAQAAKTGFCGLWAIVYSPKTGTTTRLMIADAFDDSCVRLSCVPLLPLLTTDAPSSSRQVGPHAGVDRRHLRLVPRPLWHVDRRQEECRQGRVVDPDRRARRPVRPFRCTGPLSLVDPQRVQSLTSLCIAGSRTRASGSARRTRAGADEPQVRRWLEPLPLSRARVRRGRVTSLLQGGVLMCNLCEVWVLYNDEYEARTGRTRTKKRRS